MTTIGKLWTGAVAYVSLLVGAGLSVAGNLADTYRTRGADIDNLDRIMAAAWPILVILAIEMFVSPRWSPRPMFQVWRWVGCLAVGGMAMVVSWTHLHDLMASRGQLWIVTVLGPLAIDGMAIMATGLILSTRVRGHVASRWEMTADTVRPDTDTWVDDGHGHEAADCADTAIRFRGKFNDGHDRWADLVTTAADDDGHGHPSADCADTERPVTADEITAEIGNLLAADITKLNGLATWHKWTPADDRMVADMTANPIVVEHLGQSAPLPKRTRTQAGQSYPAEFADVATAWDPAQLERADMIKLSAAWFEVSPRTARRWLAAFLNEPVSGA